VGDAGHGEEAKPIGEIFLYLISHDFQKINGRIKIFEKCTSTVLHSGRLRGGRSLVPAPGRGSAVPGPYRRGARRQVRTAVPHSGKVFFLFF
jgi:hypothetical protein